MTHAFLHTSLRLSATKKIAFTFPIHEQCQIPESHPDSMSFFV